MDVTMEFPRGIITHCILLFVILTHSKVLGFMVENDTAAMMYLERFGYIDHDDMEPNMGMKEAQPMLMAFQKMCGINQTGELDFKTVEMMNTPRCGNKDMVRVPVNESDLSSNRVKRYMINENRFKWKTREVTYRMGMFSNEMQKHVNQTQVLDAIHKAFQMWSEVTNLDFIHLPNNKRVDIELSFTTRFHKQDGFPFDGPGKVLAHAFPPGESSLSGDVHFEDEEEWHVDSPKGTDVLFVAVHEIGHALGLSHSSTKGAIMAAFYGGYKPKLKLHPDDIEGIQAIYGKREASFKPMSPSLPLPVPTPKVHQPTVWRPTTATTPRTTSITTQTTPRTTTTTTTSYPVTFRTAFGSKSPKIIGGRPDLCADPKIDAITTLADGNIYVFKGSYVFQISPKGEGIIAGWPHHISFTFGGLEPNIDAAASRENGKSYFFKGGKYWRFSGTRMDPGYPKSIVKHFPGIPEDIDAAFVLLGQFYFTKGDKFWKFNPKQTPHVSSIYPLPTERWGLPRGMDAAFKASNGEVYFFKDSNYYRLNHRTFTIAQAASPYPRDTRSIWFGCTDYKADYRSTRKSFIRKSYGNNYKDKYDSYEDSDY